MNVNIDRSETENESSEVAVIDDSDYFFCKTVNCQGEKHDMYISFKIAMLGHKCECVIITTTIICTP